MRRRTTESAPVDTTPVWVVEQWFLKNGFSKEYIHEFSIDGYIEVGLIKQSGSYEYLCLLQCGRQ